MHGRTLYAILSSARRADARNNACFSAQIGCSALDQHAGAGLYAVGADAGAGMGQVTRHAVLY